MKSYDLARTFMWLEVCSIGNVPKQAHCSCDLCTFTNGGGGFGQQEGNSQLFHTFHTRH